MPSLRSEEVENSENLNSEELNNQKDDEGNDLDEKEEEGEEEEDTDDGNNDVASEGSLSRSVMIDIAEWWCHMLLKETDPNKWDGLESVLPHITPFGSKTELANRLRVVAYWQIFLWNLNMDGEFDELLSELDSLAADLEKQEDETLLEFVRILKVQHQLVNMHDKLLRCDYTHIERPGKILKATRKKMQIMFEKNQEIPKGLGQLLELDEEGSNPSSVLPEKVKHALNNEDFEFSFSTSRKSLQSLLQSWCEDCFEVPALIKLGYRDRSIDATKNRKRKSKESDKKQGSKIIFKEDTVVEDEEESENASTDSKDDDFDPNKQSSSSSEEDDIESDEETSVGFHQNVSRQIAGPSSSSDKKRSRSSSLSGQQKKRHKSLPLPSTIWPDSSDDEDLQIPVRHSRVSNKSISTPKPRRPWTEEETSYLVHAIRRYGDGKWALIKRRDRENILVNRTNVNLKDKARLLKQQSII